MPPRVSLGKGLSLAARAAKAGGACLGLALLVLSGDPAAMLGLLAVFALSGVGFLLWRIARFLESDNKRVTEDTPPDSKK